ncbi:hypothetical protein GIB67_026491 [Kingdonia uniflora]|uniref:Uncharacterized protein n=1 Tax=Kingdonia uniflora TaxID=39325 RepID=A0A7J7P6P9_9MAGN|nr:hypothetical protein GIB67_026491 [Kingdonia uniflora]
MEPLHSTTGFFRKVVKLVQIALLQSLRGHEGLLRVDDDDLTDPGLSIVTQGITVEASLKNCKASKKFTLVGESRTSALARSQSPNQQILSRYDGDSTIGHRLYKEITKVEFVKMKGKGRLTQPTNSYQCIIVTEVESFKQIGL